MATSPVQFQFGSIVLSNVVGKFSGSPHTDPSNTDVIGIRNTISARGTLAHGLPPLAAGESTSDALARLRTELMRHRRYFVWAPFGTVVVEVGDRNNPNDPDANIDLTNGPRCTGFQVISITEGVIEVEITVEVTALACSVDGGRAVLSHRWRQQEDYDKSGYCTLTTVGTIVVRPGIAAQMKTTDILNEAGVQGPRDGYQRLEPIQHGWDETATMLTYVRTDKEFEVSPPEEAMEHDGEFILFTPGNNVAAHAIISVRLKGNKGVSRQKVVELASRIIASYVIKIRLEQDGIAVPVISAKNRSQMYENTIEAQVVVLADPKKINTPTGDLRASIFSITPSDSFLRGTQAARGKSFAPPLGQAQSTDMARPDLQEPCNPIVVQELVGGIFPFSRPQLSPEALVSSPPVTPGPAAGGGGPAVPNLIAPAQPAEPGTLTPQQQQQALGFLNFLFLNGELPQFPGAAPTSDVVPGEPGGFSGLASSEFSGFTGNIIENSYRKPTPVDQIDLPVPYTVYVIAMTVGYDSGRRVVPSCGPRDSEGKLPKAPVARAHNGHAKIVVSWSATRSAAPPQIPDPYPDDDNYVLTSLDVGVDQLERHPEGNFKYRRTGVYMYDLRSVEETKIFDVIPPMILREVQAQNPAGLGTDQLPGSKDILWWGMRTAKPSTIFQG